MIGIFGDTRYTHVLTTRLVVRSLLPRNHGGVDAENVIVIDADNSSSPYLYVDIARQHGMHHRNVLRKVLVSRQFTIYQLTNTIIYDLPKRYRYINQNIYQGMDAIRFLQILKDFDGKLERLKVVLPQTISWLHQFPMSDIDGLPNVIPYAGSARAPVLPFIISIYLDISMTSKIVFRYMNRKTFQSL